METPLVSVIVVAYNQREYIDETIRSIINQKTSFPFEVLIHDDASNDGTSEIILEYAKKYPEVIYPVIQSQNQYSLGTNYVPLKLRPRARGKYVAWCEGDDYWIDQNKLQVQYDFLESHPEYSGCLHNAVIVDYVNNLTYLSENNNVDRDKTLADIIYEGGGLLNPTASFFYRSNIDDSAHLALNAPVGDHFQLVDIAESGPIRWFSKPMSAYRYGSTSSYTKRNYSFKAEALVNYSRRYITALVMLGNNADPELWDAICRRIDVQTAEYASRIAITRFLEAGSFNYSLIRRLSLLKRLQACAERALPETYYRFYKHIAMLIRKMISGTLLRSHAEAPGFDRLDVSN